MRSLYILRTFIFAFLFTCLISTFAYGAITKNGSWATINSSVKPTTVSHTLSSGTNRVVLIFVSYKDNTTWTHKSFPLNSLTAATTAQYNGSYTQASEFRVRYDSGGDAIDAELLISVDMRDNADDGHGFIGVFAVWDDDLPGTTGSKTVQVDSAGSNTVMSHVGVIQYDGVLQNAWYSDWLQRDVNATSYTLNFNTKVANCLLINMIGIHAATDISITDDSSQTSETTFSHDAGDDAKSAIYSKSLTGTGDDSVSYTLGSSTSGAIAGIILIPDTSSVTDAELIKLLRFDREQVITASSSDPTIATTLDSGSDRVVIGVLYWDDTDSLTIDTATFGGQSMTHLGQAGNTTSDVYVSAWYILETNLPANGAQSFVVTNPGTIDNWMTGVIIVENVEQEAPNGFTSGALSVNANDLTLTALSLAKEHSWIFQLWGMGTSGDANSTSIGGMDIWNTEADAAERSRFVAGSTSHDRSVTPDFEMAANRMASGLAFFLEPKDAPAGGATPDRVIMMGRAQ
jgi:hypothetical protein